ncbi:MAG: hypothetical protein HC923_12475, partial [Myxococcales bacterium]|nr:hypothetical protein [Myxococcales bacterium]
MKFQCEQCGAKFLIADEKLGPAGARVRCKKCQHLMHIPPLGAAPSAPEASGGAGTEPAGPEELGSSEELRSSLALEGPAEVDAPPDADAPLGADTEASFTLPASSDALAPFPEAPFPQEVQGSEPRDPLLGLKRWTSSPRCKSLSRPSSPRP